LAVLLSSIIRGFIFEGETSSLFHVLYELVFLTFAIVMIGVRRNRGSGARNQRANGPPEDLYFEFEA